MLLHQCLVNVIEVSWSSLIDSAVHPCHCSQELFIGIETIHDLLQASMSSELIMFDEGSTTCVRHNHIALGLTA